MRPIEMRLRTTIDKGFITYSRFQLTSRSWWNTAVRSSDSTTGGAFPERVPGHAHVSHAAALQNGVAHVLFVRHPRQLLDHAPQDAKPEVGVDRKSTRLNS